MDRADADDPAPSPFLHAGKQGPGKEEGRGEHDAEHPLPDTEGKTLQGRYVLEPSVSDEHIHPTPLFGPGGNLLDYNGLGRICPEYAFALNAHSD